MKIEAETETETEHTQWIFYEISTKKKIAFKLKCAFDGHMMSIFENYLLR